MSKCKYLIDISPYAPLCEHPCKLYGGGAVEADCDVCEYRMNDLKAENEKLRDLAKYAILCSECDALCEGCPYHTTEDGHIICTIRKAAAELGIEVSE